MRVRQRRRQTWGREGACSKWRERAVNRGKPLEAPNEVSVNPAALVIALLRLRQNVSEKKKGPDDRAERRQNDEICRHAYVCATLTKRRESERKQTEKQIPIKKQR